MRRRAEDMHSQEIRNGEKHDHLLSSRRSGLREVRKRRRTGPCGFIKYTDPWIIG